MSQSNPGFDTWSWGKGARTVRVDSAHTTAEAQKAAKQRHFISVIDEGVYQRGVFKRLGKRKKAAALFLITGGAVSKRARRRARGIFLNYINDAGKRISPLTQPLSPTHMTWTGV